MLMEPVLMETAWTVGTDTAARPQEPPGGSGAVSTTLIFFFFAENLFSNSSR